MKRQRRTVVSVRNLAIIGAGQAGMALVLGALGTVTRETVIPACYFAGCYFVGAWLTREKI